MGEHEIKKLIGRTWFDLIDNEDGSFTVESREHGDVGEEEPGINDITEAKRLVPILKEGLPGYTVKADICDEWVMIQVTPPR